MDKKEFAALSDAEKFDWLLEQSNKMAEHMNVVLKSQLDRAHSRIAELTRRLDSIEGKAPKQTGG